MRSMTKIAGSGSASGSICHRHGSADPDPDPDPPKNVMDPQHCSQDLLHIGPTAVIRLTTRLTVGRYRTLYSCTYLY
jgi:hypothetical protein